MQNQIKHFHNNLLCNKCGRYIDESSSNTNHIALMSNLFHDFYIEFSYLSMQDGMKGKCKICECCMKKFINSFTIPLQFTEYDIS